MGSLSDKDLEKARDLGAITYLSSYVHLMARHLGVNDEDNEVVNKMAGQMVEPVNLGTQAAWCALMGDRNGMNNALESLTHYVKALQP